LIVDSPFVNTFKTQLANPQDARVHYIVMCNIFIFLKLSVFSKMATFRCLHFLYLMLLNLKFSIR